jgi:hypothetical protein
MEVVAATTPVALVARIPCWMPETVRLVVLAVPEKIVPDALIAVEEANGKLEAMLVEVAMKYCAVGVVVAAMVPEPLTASSAFVAAERTGVVRVGVERDGEVPKTTAPVPVSSESHLEKSREVAKRVEVAASTHAVPLYRSRSPYAAAVMVTSLRSLMPEEETALRHEPLMSLKQPPESWMPLAKVEEAAVPVMCRYEDEIPLVKVEVAGPWTMRVPVVVAPPKMVRPVVVAPAPIVVEARNMLVPVKVLLLERSVEEAAVMVMEPPTEREVPFTVPRGPVR